TGACSFLVTMARNTVNGFSSWPGYATKSRYPPQRHGSIMPSGQHLMRRSLIWNAGLPCAPHAVTHITIVTETSTSLSCDLKGKKERTSGHFIETAPAGS